MLKQRLSLGKYFGIGLYVHWTFGLLLAFVAFQSWEGGLAEVAFSIVIVLSVFLCVTLHEYGHSLAARRFGIGTVDITLLPIGGVARLERMPRVPWKELVVAVAGPAVNVVIASVLLVVLLTMLGSEMFAGLMVDTGAAMVGSESVVAESEAVTTPAMAEAAAEMEDASLFGPIGILSYVYTLALINVALVIFNMIPAFPMDGGRVLRSVLAMMMSYAKATYIASRIGLVCAAIMAVMWFAGDQQSPVPVLIAMFIAYAGMSEAKQVEVTEAVRGLVARDVMIQNPPSVSMDTPLATISQTWQSSSVAAMPVVSLAGTVVGILRLSTVSSSIQNGVDPATTAGQMADHDATIVRQHDSLEDVLPTLARNERQLAVVDASGQLVGLLDLDSLRIRAALG
ncbi:site-2 protease family protein [Planctomycetes bacterium K23_9]|uniref:Zinc metalloprotease n=1 Tax=Stieleria marina TaxID=1930275 RepID=A0A517P0Q5_9BACT|nr:Putative zinc metalloprotease Rip3 [Planctomycetes bacterium K23_9]